jgi:nucleoside-diphosphate-sugar epimerase
LTIERDIRGTRSVVTGGLGFIGSTLALRLHGLGSQVTVVDALVDGHGGNRANLDGADGEIEIVIADAGDREAVEPSLARADFVFDLAGQSSHLASARDPGLDFQLNATSRLRLLETLRAVNPRVRAVFTSTRQVYGRPRELPVTEATQPRPADVNGVAKLAAEHLYLLHHSQHGLEAVVLRLSNVFGPRQHLHSDELGVLPVFVRRALRGEPLALFGDGSDERDALYVDDAVDAILAAALSPDAVGLVMNVGHRERLTLLEMAKIICEAAPSGPSIVREPWPEEHAALAVGSSYMSSELAERTLGWRPRHTFADAVPQTLEWFARHPERFR